MVLQLMDPFGLDNQNFTLRQEILLVLNQLNRWSLVGFIFQIQLVHTSLYKALSATLLHQSTFDEHVGVDKAWLLVVDVQVSSNTLFGVKVLEC